MSAGGSPPEKEKNSPLAWLERAVIYQIYVQSFCDSNGDGIGDLRGIAEKLEYLEWLGVDLLWLSPIYRSPFKDAGYDITDHRAVAERYGTLRDFDRLVAECHRRGMRVILDLVPAHTSNEHAWFKLSAGAQRNRYTDWYIWTDSGFGDLDQELVRGFGERQGHYKPNFFWFQPALNYGYAAPTRPWQHSTASRAAREVFAELLRTMRFWLDRGVDGFRADMAASLVKDDPDGRENQRLWRKVRAWMDRSYPDRLLVSEWSWPSRAIDAGFHVDFMIHFNNDGYNSLFRLEPGRNVFPSQGHSFFDRAGEGDVTHFLTLFRSFLKKTRGRGFISIPTGNHDLPRLNCRRSTRELRAAYVFLLTLPAVPTIYYGDEIGMRNINGVANKEGGFVRTQARAPMLWRAARNGGFSDADAKSLYLPIDRTPPLGSVEEQRSDSRSLLHFVRRLIAWRKDIACLGASGAFIPLHAEKSGYPLAYLRRLGGQEALVVVNPCGRTTEAHLASLRTAHGWQVLVRSGIAFDGATEGSVRCDPFGYLIAVRNRASSHPSGTS